MARKVKVGELQLKDKLVYIGRVAKVVKGGRRFSFTSVIVVGDGNGHVGVGLGKANEVSSAIAKGSEDARKNIIYIPLRKGTLPHPVIGKYGAGKVLLKPASPGYRFNSRRRCTGCSGSCRCSGCFNKIIGFFKSA